MQALQPNLHLQSTGILSELGSAGCLLVLLSVQRCLSDLLQRGWRQASHAVERWWHERDRPVRDLRILAGKNVPLCTLRLFHRSSAIAHALVSVTGGQNPPIRVSDDQHL